MASRSVRPFLRDSPTEKEARQTTERGTSVGMGRSCATHAMRPAGSSVCVCETQLICEVPLELLELILMRAFVMLYVHHYRTAIICAGERTFSTLARVSSVWWQTLDGWPDSDTRLWLKHQIVKRVASQFLRRRLSLYRHAARA